MARITSRREVLGALSSGTLVLGGWPHVDRLLAAPAPSEAATPNFDAPGPGPSAPLMLEPQMLAGNPAPPGAGATLGYGTVSPGPILRVRKGQSTPLRITNRLARPTSLDWHGLRIAGSASADGVPIPAGGRADLTLTFPDSGTFWFHPGFAPATAGQTAQGLAGVLVVEEPSPPEVDTEHVLVLADRSPGETSGRPAPAPRSPVPLADALSVNGAAWPAIETVAPGARLRLRIVNASTRLALAAAFEGGRPYVVAIDGQPSELFVPLADTVPIGPGARFDVVLDVPTLPRAEVRLVLRGAEAATGEPGVAWTTRLEGSPKPARPPIAPLPPNPLLPPYIPLEKSVRASIVVATQAAAAGGAGARYTVNGVPGAPLPARPLFSVKRGAAVTLAVRNSTATLTAFRLHGHAMRLLHALDDGWEPYWRDSVLVAPGVTHHAAFLADNPGRWLIESSFAEQAATGWRTWFEVV